MMKNSALLAAIFLFLFGCDKHEEKDDKVASTKIVDCSGIFAKRIHDSGRIAFRAWDGQPKRSMDLDSILFFSQDSKVELADLGYSARRYSGTYEVGPDCQVQVALIGYEEGWPRMILRQDGEDLILYREDGQKSRFPKGGGHYYLQERDGFWPFRATADWPPQAAAETPAQQGTAPNGP